MRDAARRAVAELEAHARPAGTFDASRYFRADEAMEFLNTGTTFVRALARAIADEHRDDWSIREAVAFANRLIADTRLEVKGVGLELLARYRRQLTPALLPTFKRWLSANHCANWATTDTLCGSIIGPLVLAFPELVSAIASWTRHRNLWVRRAAAVSLIKSAARGHALDAAYDVATALRSDEHDLIHKAVGWLLREAGKTDAARLDRYLRDFGPEIPRTTVRYAIERFPIGRRQELLIATRRVRPTASQPGRSGSVTTRRRPGRTTAKG
ncbi:MAG: DNA alkylation repair protein [Vicinamibacterales bacterium]